MNPHARRRSILSRVRLPIPARSRVADFRGWLSGRAAGGHAADRSANGVELALEVGIAAIEEFQALHGGEALGRQTTSQLADRLALVLGHGLPADFADRSLQEAARLSPADLQAAARRLLGRPSLSLCGPAKALQQAERVWRQHPLSG